MKAKHIVGIVAVGAVAFFLYRKYKGKAGKPIPTPADAPNNVSSAEASGATKTVTGNRFFSILFAGQQREVGIYYQISSAGFKVTAIALRLNGAIKLQAQNVLSKQRRGTVTAQVTLNMQSYPVFVNYDVDKREVINSISVSEFKTAFMGGRTWVRS